MERTPEQYDTPPWGYLPYWYYHRTRRSRICICGTTRFSRWKWLLFYRVAHNQTRNPRRRQQQQQRRRKRVVREPGSRMPCQKISGCMVKRPRTAKQRLGWNRYKVPGVNYKGTGRKTIMVRPLRRQQGLCTVTYLSTQPPAHPPTHSPTNPTPKPISTPIPHPPTHPPICACYLVYCTCSYNTIPTWYSSTVEITP